MALQEELRAQRESVPPPRRRRRWDLLAAGAVILLPTLVVAALLALRQRVDDLEERLVREANALVARTQPRPVHRGDPLPGSLGEALTEHLPGLARAEERLADHRDLLREVGAGERPLEAVPPTARAALAEAGPDLDAVLRGTRAARADATQAIGFTGGPAMATLQFGVLLAGYRVRQAMRDGRPREAVEEALDALALGRDVALAGGLVGHMSSVAMVARTTLAAASAMDALPRAADRHEAMAALRRIREGFPLFSRTLADEMVLSHLRVGQAMSPRALAALSAPARALAAENDLDGWRRLIVRDAWREMRRANDAMIAAADLPEDERQAAWEAAFAGLKRSPNPLGQISMPNYERYKSRGEATLRRLDALILVGVAGAVRRERGRWPEGLEELAGEGGLLPDEIRRLDGTDLSAQPDGSLRVAVPLPQGGDKDPASLELVLRPPR